MSRFAELHAEIDAWRATHPGQHWPDEAFASALPILPLFHRLGVPIPCSGELRLEPVGPKAAREALGTDGCLFTSLGFPAFVVPPIVLAFGPLDELPLDRLTAPWDSRGVGGLMRWGPEYHRSMVDRYSLPGGLDECFLARYMACLYDGPHELAAGQKPRRRDGLGIVRRIEEVGVDHTPFTTPEGRWSNTLVLDDNLLLAAFADPVALLDRKDGGDWARLLACLRKRLGSRYHTVTEPGGLADIQGVAAAFTRVYMAQEGVMLG